MISIFWDTLAPGRAQFLRRLPGAAAALGPVIRIRPGNGFTR